VLRLRESDDKWLFQNIPGVLGGPLLGRQRLVIGLGWSETVVIPTQAGMTGAFGVSLAETGQALVRATAAPSRRTGAHPPGGKRCPA